MKKGFFLVMVAAVCIGMVGVVYAGTRTVSFDPVTTYTDNTPIEVGNTVSYSVWIQDNVTKTTTQLADHILTTSQTFSDAGFTKNRVYNFTAQAHLLSGDSSDISPVFPWLFPKGKAKSPLGGWAITP
jgi:hypothetical protein